MIAKYKLKKGVLSPIGKKDFKDGGELPWLDQDNATSLLESSEDYQTFPKEIREQIKHFVDNGFMVLRGHYSQETIDNANRTIEELLASKKIEYNYSGRKLMNAYEASEEIEKTFFRDQKILNLFRFIFRKDIIPFQTIHFLRGSEQRAHSESIHMSTYPEGYLIASWTALEDIGMDQGPVFYYPGSHRLPYVSCEDYESGNTSWQLGTNSYAKYEDYIDALIREKGLQPEYFTAKKGDVLIWHANLLHGGSPIQGDQDVTRKSMVAHYYADDVVCYHEISQRHALIKK